MFGKKNNDDAKVKKDFQCKLCGLDCKSEDALQRHMAWAHKDTPMPGNSDGSKT